MKYYSEKLDKMFDTQKALETAERIYKEKEEKVEDEPMTEEESKRLAEKEKKAKKEELEKKFNEIKAAHEKREIKLDEKISAIKDELSALLKEKEEERETYLSKLRALQKEYATVKNHSDPVTEALETAIFPLLQILNLL